MKTALRPLTGFLFIGIAAVLGLSQLSVGGSRLLLGLGMAAPWALAGVAIAALPRLGAWLGVAVSAISLAAASWILSQANEGSGRWIAERLFASPDGTFSWAGIYATTAGLAILFIAALALALTLASRSRTSRQRIA